MFTEIILVILFIIIIYKFDSLKKDINNISERLNILEKKTGIKNADISVHRTEGTVEKEELTDKQIDEKIDKQIAKEKEKPEQEEPKQTETNIEEDIGLKWFGRIGILSLAMGVVFLLKYAFDNDIIGPLGRVILGVAIGLVLIVGGEVFDERKKYKNYARMLTGGGFAITYFAIYAAYYFEKYRDAIGMSQTINLILLNIIVLLSIVFSLRYNSKIILTESFFLGYLTILMNPVTLFTLMYALILTIGLLTITSIKKWIKISIGGLLATYFIFWTWIDANQNETSTALTFLFIYFAIFTINSFLCKNDKNSSSSLNKILVALTSLFFYLSSYFIMLDNNLESYLGLFTLFVSALYIGLAYLASEKNRFLAPIFLGLCVIYLTITIPVQFDGIYVTMMWAVEGLILMHLALKLNEKKLRYLSYAVGIITFFKTLVVDSSLHAFSFPNIWESTRLISYMVSVLILYEISLMLWKNKEALPIDEKSYYKMYFLSATLLTTALLGMELKHYWISIGWAIQAMIILFIGIKYMKPYLRKSGIALFVIVILKVFLFDISELSTGYRTISFMILGVILMIVSFVYTKYKDRLKEII